VVIVALVLVMCFVSGKNVVAVVVVVVFTVQI